MDEQPVCLFKSIRGNLRCTSSSETPFGFCKGHRATIQAKAAKAAYEAEKEERETKKEERVSTPKIEDAPKIVSPPPPPEEDSDDSQEDFSIASDSDDEEHVTPAAILVDPRGSKKEHVTLSSEKEKVKRDADYPQRDAKRFTESRTSLNDNKRLVDKTSLRHSREKEHKVVTSSSRTLSRPVPTPKPTDDSSYKQSRTIQSQSAQKTFVMKPNYWGRYEDKDTGIVFDPKTKAAYGVQNRLTGGVAPLSREHEKICEHKGWAYHAQFDSDEDSDNDASTTSDNSDASNESYSDSDASGSDVSGSDSDDSSEESE